MTRWLFFSGEKPKTRAFCSDFCGQFRDYCAISPASVKDHSSASPGLHPSDWNQRVGMEPKGRNFIPPDKSKSAVCSRCLRHVQSRTPSCFPVTDARDIFHSKCPLHRPQAVGILIFGGPPPCSAGCQPDSALIEDTGDHRYYSGILGALLFHALHQFYKTESYHLTPQ